MRNSSESKVNLGTLFQSWNIQETEVVAVFLLHIWYKQEFSYILEYIYLPLLSVFLILKAKEH